MTPASLSSTSKTSWASSAARDGFAAWRRAAIDFDTLLRRLNIRCQLEPRTALTIA